jgi:hypothetical protein
LATRSDCEGSINKLDNQGSTIVTTTSDQWRWR